MDKNLKNRELLDNVCLNAYSRKKYVNNELNPAYASDLEDFIKGHSQIKLWTHGHIHSSSDYKIDECRVLCNPYGYAGYEQKLCARKYFGKVVEV